MTCLPKESLEQSFMDTENIFPLLSCTIKVLLSETEIMIAYSSMKFLYLRILLDFPGRYKEELYCLEPGEDSLEIFLIMIPSYPLITWASCCCNISWWDVAILTGKIKKVLGTTDKSSGLLIGLLSWIYLRNAFINKEDRRSNGAPSWSRKSISKIQYCTSSNLGCINLLVLTAEVSNPKFVVWLYNSPSSAITGEIREKFF